MSMEKKFTPGPWTISPHAFNEIRASANSGIPFLVATANFSVSGSGRVVGDLDVAQANATLISCAPEMFEAMEKFCNQVKSEEFNLVETYDEFMELLTKATKTPQ